MWPGASAAQSSGRCGLWLAGSAGAGCAVPPLTDDTIKSAMPVYVRDIGIEVPSGHLVTGHIIATDPHGQSTSAEEHNAGSRRAASFTNGEVVIYRVLRGTAEIQELGWRDVSSLPAGDVVTAGKSSISLVGDGRKHAGAPAWSSAGHEDAFEAGRRPSATRSTASRPDHHTKDIRLRTEGKPIGYLYVAARKTACRSGRRASYQVMILNALIHRAGYPQNCPHRRACWRGRMTSIRSSARRRGRRH